jgi:deazaflavin-dependent oxidoreductase (nitroreductase family)
VTTHGAGNQEWTDRVVAAMSDWNDKVIAEFRANGGKVGGDFEGFPLLLLHSTGARSGAERVNPVAYQALDDGRWAVFASKAGAPENPDWFHNLRAHPETTIEVGTETVPVVARVLAGDERAVVWEEQKRLAPGFADYETKTGREIPVVELTRR